MVSGFYTCALCCCVWPCMRQNLHRKNSKTTVWSRLRRNIVKQTETWMSIWFDWRPIHLKPPVNLIKKKWLILNILFKSQEFYGTDRSVYQWKIKWHFHVSCHLVLRLNQFNIDKDKNFSIQLKHKVLNLISSELRWCRKKDNLSIQLSDSIKISK